MTNEEAISYLKWVRPIKPYTPDKKGVQEAIDMAIKALSAEKTAEWHIVGKTTLHYECSKCGGAGDKWDKFCKHCGRRMNNQECDNNHDCEHCDWTECPVEVETDGESK